MKTQILLFSFLCIFAFSVQAQVPLRNGKQHPGSEQVGSWFNPKGSDFWNADRMSIPKYCDLKQPQNSNARIMVPAKRNMFSPNAYSWQWDTIICYTVASGSNPSQRVTRMYNSMGDSVVQLMERRQGSLLWENYARETFTYDSAGNCLTHLQERWQNNVWVNFVRQEFVYNTNGDEVDWKRVVWDSVAWDNMWHYSWHFNVNGLNDTCLYQVGQDSLWINNMLSIPSYDGNGIMISWINNTWINNSWQFYTFDTVTLDANNYYHTHLQQKWVNSSWANNCLYTMTHYTAGNTLTWLYQEWQNNAWLNVKYDSSVYDPNGNKTEEIDHFWSGGTWVNTSRDYYVYDTSNNMLSHTSQSWDNSSWRYQNAQIFTYDSLGNSLTGKNLHWYISWQPADGGLAVYANHQQDIVLQGICQYAAVIDSVLVFMEPALSSELVKLYPNPAQSMVYLTSPGASTDQNRSLTMYDLRGQIVLTKQVVNEKTGIDVSGLKSGVYFVRYSDDRMTKALKFVKN